MDLTQYVRQLMARVHRQIDAVMGVPFKDTTEAQFNWQPPGTGNRVGTTFIHVLNAEDFHVQTIVQGKPRIWETGSWSERIGLENPPGRGRNWEEARIKALDLAAVLDYAQAVRAATEGYLAGLTAEELDRRVSFFGEERPVAEVLAALAIHLAGHAGEIAAMKGIQGVKGLPF